MVGVARGPCPVLQVDPVVVVPEAVQEDLDVPAEMDDHLVEGVVRLDHLRPGRTRCPRGHSDRELDIPECPRVPRTSGRSKRGLTLCRGRRSRAAAS